MGAQFRLNIREESDLATVMDEFSGRTIATSSLVGENIDAIDFGGPILLLVGGEGTGLSEALLKKANRVASIPLDNKVESLNVGSAGAILCFCKSRSS
jgi:TrmH family RNA methyltransferase